MRPGAQTKMRRAVGAGHGGMYAATTGQPANVCLPGGAVKTAPYKVPVNDSP